MSDNIATILSGLLPLAFYIALFLIVYVETAFVFAFFIPGDTLLFAAGLVVAVTSNLNIVMTCFVISLAAFLGDQTAFHFGKKYGIEYITSRNRPHLNTMLEKAKIFYLKHGRATIFLSRFYPWFRTLAPFLAGIGQMPRKKFISINLVSAFSWGTGITLIGYFANSIEILKNASRWIAVFFILLTVFIASRNILRERQLSEIDL
jgi:membrane-associated protein